VCAAFIIYIPYHVCFLFMMLYILMFVLSINVNMNAMQDGEAESYRNVEVEFVPGRQAKMTIYEDGVAIAGEAPIDMTLFVTKEAMHKLMVDKGFEKLTPAEVEVRKLEKSKLFPTSTSTSTSTTQQKEGKVQRRETRDGRAAERDASRRAAKEERQRQKEDREILGVGPDYMKMMQVYVGAAAVAALVAVYAGVRRQRRRRPTALRVGLSS
jgi:hypothetical protein